MPPDRSRPNAPIGVFDSGIGGLTVVKELTRALPHEDIVYLGDTEHLPYGNKSEAAVRDFSLRNTRFLQRHHVKMIVIACNTASAVALDHIRERVDIPVIGVVESGAAAAAACTRSGRIGVVGTKTTIRTGAYSRAIRAIDSGIDVMETATPLLVHLVEEAWINRPVTSEIIREYLAPMRSGGIDTLVLGCTHYPFLKGVISGLAPELTLVDSATATAEAVDNMLSNLSLHAERTVCGGLGINLTDIYADIESLTLRFLGTTVAPSLVVLGSLSGPAVQEPQSNERNPH